MLPDRLRPESTGNLFDGEDRFSVTDARYFDCSRIHRGRGFQSRKAAARVAAAAGGGVTVETVFTSKTKSAGDIAKEALELGWENILVAGGDGTVGMVAKELVEKPATLGILPMGTYNNIARSAGIPFDLDAACDVITAHHRHAIDVGLLNEEHYFFEAVGAGLDAELFPVGEEIKDGNWMAAFDALRTAADFKSVDLQLTFDRTIAAAVPEPLRASYPSSEIHGRSLLRRPLFLVIANGGYYGSGFRVSPEAEVDNGSLTVSIYSKFTKAELAAHFFALHQGLEVDRKGVETFVVSEVLLDSTDPVAIHADGIPVGTTPARVRILPGVLKIWAPRLQDETPEEEAPQASVTQEVLLA